MRAPTRLAIAVLAAWLVAGAAGAGLADRGNRIALEHILARPSAAAVLGRDDLGRPLAPRLAAGAGASLAIAVTVVAATALIGVAIGIAAAWVGGMVDLLLARLIDVFLAFPGILLAIALAGILGPGAGNVVIALTVVGWVGFARLARALAAAIRGRDHVQVARALGTPALLIVWRHVLPLMRAPLLVEASFAFAGVIVAEAGLSYLGLGLQPPTPSWGGMIRDGTRYLLVAPHVVLAPGLALASVLVAVTTLGDRLRAHWQLPR
jgi:peptide/nickel transport system permease protein